MTTAVEPWDGADGARLRAAQRRGPDDGYGTDDHAPGEPPTADNVGV
jgi:putative acetyltransferase